jgi:diguanylate cyclase (GGDEF)-like protein
MNPDHLQVLPAGDALHALFGRRPRILAVDDQPANVQVLYQAFAADHQVFMATSGEQALEVCAAKQPDLILLDVVMPGMDGYTLCRHLKADEHTRDIPVIFVTSHRDEAAETRGLEVGAVDFISKPINPAIVRARARTHLTLKAQSDLLRKWVYTDGLTNVSNRRYFEQRLNEEWARAVRQGSPLSVVMIDVDHFKRYNDRYGHQAGDECLRRLAAELTAAVKRPTDLVARYGGEEFVCLLSETPLAGAMQVAQHIGERVREAAIEHDASDTGPIVTVSMGVASRSDAVPGTGPALVRAADAQLYRAKAEGRNRFCSEELLPS